MAAQAPNIAPLLAPDEVAGAERDLFRDFEVTDSRRGHGGKALPLSLAAHALVALTVLLVPLWWSSDPPPLNVITVLYNPPPPPPPPLSLGSAQAKPQPPQPKPDAEPKQATPKPNRSFTVPEEPKPIEPETSKPVPEQAGSPEGSASGTPDGMLGGIDGGTVGGVLGGQLGGVIGGTGDVVADYDVPPRPLHVTKPVFPNEAFVKKIEGKVVVEILIDAAGRVTARRIIESIPALDRAAVECVSQWTFSPAMKHGRPVASLAEAPVTFRVL